MMVDSAVQINILWSSKEYHSLENCLINIAIGGIQITSTIIGYYQEKIFKVEYFIKTNTNGETIFVTMTFWQDNLAQFIRLEKDENGNWLLNGHIKREFKDCMDIDIPLTPLTNTLPIRRLRLSAGQSQEIKVIYCDLFSNDTNQVRQKYSCISDTEYHYQNIPNDFESTIKVDEEGFVIDYPFLFERIACLKSR